MTTITVITLILLTISISNAARITPLLNHSGIYYELVGEAHITTGQWTVLSMLNISLYEIRLEQVSRILSLSENWFAINATESDISCN